MATGTMSLLSPQTRRRIDQFAFPELLAADAASSPREPENLGEKRSYEDLSRRSVMRIDASRIIASLRPFCRP